MYSFKDDAGLIADCLRKDPEAWAFFISRYSKLIRYAIRARLIHYGYRLSSQDIEDIQQIVLSFLWEEDALEKIRNREKVTGWLAIVSGNAALRYIRKRRYDNSAQTVSIDEVIGDCALEEAIPSKEPHARETAGTEECRSKISEVISNMSEKERLIIKLKLYHGKTHEEICGILHIPMGTVSSYIKRAKEKLRNELKDFI